jgi:hypothetical protein
VQVGTLCLLLSALLCLSSCFGGACVVVAA